MLTSRLAHLTDQSARGGTQLPSVGDAEWELRTGPLPSWRGRIVNAHYHPRDEMPLTPHIERHFGAAMRQRPAQWRDFMMRYELGLETQDPKRALQSALTIALSYVVGGLIPLSPYLVVPSVHTALMVSIIVALIALIVFGYVKGHFTGACPLRSALQTTVIGGLAAAVAFGIARAIS